MVEHDRSTFLSVYSSSTLLRVAWMALAMGAYAILAVWKENSHLSEMGDIPAELHTALSLVLGLLLVFRTNAAYSRWWEARTLWGALVNASRNLAAKFVALTRVEQEEVVSASRLVATFPYALRDHLRGETDNEWPLRLEPEHDEAIAAAEHKPGAITKLLYLDLGRWKEAGLIDGDELRVIDRDLAKQLDICGGCERILKTRIAKSYRRFARQCVLLFLLTLPWGIVNTFHWWTIPLTAILSYFMIGLEVVAEHVEEPFGYDEDDLDLDGLCKTIERTVDELVG